MYIWAKLCQQGAFLVLATRKHTLKELQKKMTFSIKYLKPKVEPRLMVSRPYGLHTLWSPL